MKKFILILLALVMVVSVFASCGGGNKTTTPKPTTPSGGGGGTTTDPQAPEEEQLNLDLDAIDYEGQVVSVFHWSGSAPEFGMELEDVLNDAVNDATYKRNLATETDLGIEIEWALQANTSYPKSVQFVDKLETRISDPTTPVDIIAGNMRSMPFFLVEGHLTELSTYSDTLDLNKVWWPGDVQDAISVKGNLYFVSGDIALSLLRNMSVLFVNKTRLEAIGQNYDELMQNIIKGEWYLEDLIQLTQGEYLDMDDIKGPSANDRFGLITLYYKSDAIYTGLGYKYMTESTRDNEFLRLSSQMASETSMQYVTLMKDWQLDNDFYMKYLDPEEATYGDNFKNGLSLFCLDLATFGFSLQETAIKFACLPAPRLDANQDRYYTNVQGTYTGYGICTTSPDYDVAAETIQVLGYYGYKLTTPAVFEVSFQGKFAKDDYNIEMFNIIRDSIVFDTGKVYDVFVATQIDGFDWIFLEYIVSNVVSYGIKGNEQGEETNFNFPSTGDPVRKKVQTCIDMANAKILEYIDSQG